MVDDTTGENQLTQAAKVLESVAKPLMGLVTLLLPWMIITTHKLWTMWRKLPKNVGRFVTGAIFCFFGGLYPTLFAAVQAAEHGGRTVVVDAMRDLSSEAMIIIEESKKDDKQDDDKDGVSDTAQISNKEFMVRKTKLVLKKMNPEKVDKAIASLYRVWLAVVAVLTIQFARTISLALTISDFLRMPIDRFVAPTLSQVIPAEYKKWVPTVLGWITKSISISIAWYLQTIISAFSSALAGGLMMARAMYAIGTERGIFTGNHDETPIDEILSYVFAAIGFYFQYSINFDVPFPFSMLLFPLEIIEWKIRWTISS